MKYVDQKGRCYEEETFQDKFLKLLYGTYIGRIKLKILTKPWISRLGGLFSEYRLLKVSDRAVCQKK